MKKHTQLKTIDPLSAASLLHRSGIVVPALRENAPITAAPMASPHATGLNRITLMPLSPRKRSRGFTMVEMLAVLAVMAVIIALTIPNGIFARTTGEEAVAKAQAASFELAMNTYLLRSGAAANASWQSAHAADPSTHNLFLVLQQAGAFPASTGWQTIEAGMAGYTIIFPPSLTGKLSVVRTSDNAVIYP